MPRGFRQQLPVGAGLGVGIADRPEAIQIKPRIGEVLIGGEPAHAFGHERACRFRHARDLVFQIGERGGRRLVALRRIGAQMRAAARRFKAGAEAAQIGLDRLAVGADRRLEGVGRDRQRAGAGDGAEHHRIDHGAALARDRFEIEQQRAFRILLDRLDEPLLVIAAVAHRHLLHHQIRAAGRGDGRGAVGRDKAAGDGAAGFHQFAGDDEIDIADARRQREDRAALVGLARRRRHQLDVIGGRAGALRDARNRRRLHRKILALRRRHDPIGEHAATLAAKRGDQDSEGTCIALRLGETRPLSPEGRGLG